MSAENQECPTCNGDCGVPAVTEREMIWPDMRGIDGEPLVNCPDCTPRGCPYCGDPRGSTQDCLACVEWTAFHKQHVAFGDAFRHACHVCVPDGAP